MSDKIASKSRPSSRLFRGLRAASRVAANTPPIWRAFRWLAEGDYRRAAAVVDRFRGVEEHWIDLGCGEAPLASRIPPDRYTGVDLDPRRLDRARRNNPAHTFINHDLTRGPDPLQPSERFLLAHLLHHLDDPQVEALRRTLTRLALPGARVLVIDPLPPAQSRKPLHRALLPLETGQHHRPLEQVAALLGVVPEARGQDAGSFWYDAYWFFGTLGPRDGGGAP